MRLVFAGTPAPAVVALRKLIYSEHEVVAVITRPDARRGRGRSLHPSPVKELALQHGIKVLTPTSLRADTADGQALRAELAALAVEAIPVVAYGNLVPQDLLDIVPHGWVNLHFSLLPRWRGAAPVQAAIAAGDEITGATTFRIEEGLDTGVVLGSIEQAIAPTDTADDLLSKLAHSGADLLVETMTGLENGSITPQPQAGDVTYAQKILSEDARIDWTQPAPVIDRHIRAHTPSPGAWTLLDGQRFKLGPVRLAAVLPAEVNQEAAPPGSVCATKSAVFVTTGSGVVELGNIQPPGKKLMNAADWARGALQGITEGVNFA